MWKLIDAFLCGGMLLAELLLTLIIAMLVQGLVYWTTGFSIYNYIRRKFYEMI